MLLFFWQGDNDALVISNGFCRTNTNWFLKISLATFWCFFVYSCLNIFDTCYNNSSCEPHTGNNSNEGFTNSNGFNTNSCRYSKPSQLVLSFDLCYFWLRPSSVTWRRPQIEAELSFENIQGKTFFEASVSYKTRRGREAAAKVEKKALPFQPRRLWLGRWRLLFHFCKRFASPSYWI